MIAYEPLQPFAEVAIWPSNLWEDRMYVVAETHEKSGRGTAVFFEGDPAIVLPLGQRRVEISTPAGRRLATQASVESARKVPPGEVLSMLFSDHSPSDIPVGSTVTIVED